MKGSTIAGAGAAICFIVTFLVLLSSPTDSGVEYIGVPGLFVLGCVFAWFWYKGSFGTDEERQWVENNF